MSKIPKKCLTCAFMDFVDDELNEMRCYNPKTDYYGITVEDDFICQDYEINELVIEDAKQGCW